ncbi:hypothetical protein POPTR_001G015601v4 [Populus trichocarpa]|uniref:Uncharacterized protein n=1 Tax=Populus trichocarpa TaxID=3694 RepID=A0ACC0TGB7_POPTR|nr:hypothetical protein POPTR_001G015601v4 [Populus trichocarpa]
MTGKCKKKQLSATLFHHIVLFFFHTITSFQTSDRDAVRNSFSCNSRVRKWLQKLIRHNASSVSILQFNVSIPFINNSFKLLQPPIELYESRIYSRFLCPCWLYFLPKILLIGRMI